VTLLRSATQSKRRAARGGTRTVDEAAQADQSRDLEQQPRREARGAGPHDVLEKGGPVLIPEPARELAQLGPDHGGVQLQEERLVVGGEQLEELLVRERLDARNLQLEERVLARVEIRSHHALGALQRHVQHVAATAREHEDGIIARQVQQLAVDARVLPAHIVDDGLADQSVHGTILQLVQRLRPRRRHAVDAGAECGSET